MTGQSNPAAKPDGLACAYVPMTEDRAKRLLEDQYGMTGALKRFDTEKDDTFRVTTEDDRKFILKVANPDEPFKEIEFQNNILRYVETRDPTLPVPRVINSEVGHDIAQIKDVDGSQRWVRLLTFLEGTPLDETQSDPLGRIQIGKMLARLRFATEGFSHEMEDRYYGWDVQRLLTLEHLLDEVDNDIQRRALSQGLERFRQIELKLRLCRKQVLHNDFSKSNIIVDHDNPAFVTGVIDFGDAVKTAIAVDVATAVLNQLPETPNEDLFYRARDILKGYLSIAELTNEELALIPHLVMGRIVTRALLTLWRVKLFPENKRYIMRNTEQGWHQLDWFLARSAEEVSDILTPFFDNKRTL